MALGDALLAALQHGTTARWLRHVNGNHYRALLPLDAHGVPCFAETPAAVRDWLSADRRAAARQALTALDARAGAVRRY